MTDPFQNAWTAIDGSEIGDLCNNISDTNQILGDTHIWVQDLWDNVTNGGGPGLSNCVWWSNHRDYIEAMSFQDNDSIQFPLRMKSTPPSFRCHVSSSPDLASALRRFRAQPGVLSVFSSP